MQSTILDLYTWANRKENDNKRTLFSAKIEETEKKLAEAVGAKYEEYIRSLKHYVVSHEEEIFYEKQIDVLNTGIKIGMELQEYLHSLIE